MPPIASFVEFKVCVGPTFNALVTAELAHGITQESSFTLKICIYKFSLNFYMRFLSVQKFSECPFKQLCDFYTTAAASIQNRSADIFLSV